MCELQAQRVMDFGAGRGAPLLRETRRWRKDLLDLRQHGAEVYACDIDPAVKSHQWSDHQVVLDARSIPFEDEFFDMIVSDVTFEHIREPERVAAELVRVLRPGGFICARTPNRYGYPKFFASLVPNKLHARVLSYVQPRGRQEADIFPTAFSDELGAAYSQPVQGLRRPLVPGERRACLLFRQPYFVSAPPSLPQNTPRCTFDLALSVHQETRSRGRQCY